MLKKFKFFNKKYFSSIIATTIVVTTLFTGFIGYSTYEYVSSVESKMKDYIADEFEPNPRHLCLIAKCCGYFKNGEYTSVSNQHQMTKPPDELFRYGEIAFRTNFRYTIDIKDYDNEYIICINFSDIVIQALIIYFVLIVVFNITIILIVKGVIEKEEAQHEITLNTDKTELQFANLTYYIENLNHEVNSPLFILSRKIKVLERLIDKPKEFKIINDSIEQIAAVMQRTREVKNINKSSKDRTIHDLIESTIDTINIMRSEHVDVDICEELNTYCLNQDKMMNGTFINILTNHVKNSIEAYADFMKFEMVAYNNKGLLSFKFTDNGNGIPNDVRWKVFEKGFSTKGDKLVRGSGMSINKIILESVGGSVQINDSDEGAQFEIDIPVKIRRFED